MRRTTIERKEDERVRYRGQAASINLRAAPSISSEVVGFLQKGDLAILLQKSEDDYWLKVQIASGEIGWASHKFLTCTEHEEMAEQADPPWLRIAVNEIGVKEYVGAADNPRIVEYHQSTALVSDLATQDETPWCSSFINWCCERSGYEGTDSAWARSWLRWGMVLDPPRRGCIVIFSRPPDPGAGHVAFYIQETRASIEVLGGNQNDAVSISPYPKERLLGYRWAGLR